MHVEVLIVNKEAFSHSRVSVIKSVHIESRKCTSVRFLVVSTDTVVHDSDLLNLVFQDVAVAIGNHLLLISEDSSS